MEIGALRTPKRNKILIRNEDQKRLDFSINMSHNNMLSNNNVIRLVKLLARQAAEEDYMQSFIQIKVVKLMKKRVSVYARYSSDLQSDASIEDQIRLCTEKAAAEK